MIRHWPAALAWGTALLVCVGLYASGDPYWLRLGTTLAVNIALATGWNIIGGMAGYPSFATAAFFGFGAYAGALLQGVGMPMPLAWTGASLGAAALALALGWIVLRLRGHYFAIASLTIVAILRLVATNATDLTGGGMGLSLPVLTSGVTEQARFFFVAQAIVAIAAVLAAIAVARSSIGFALHCIRQNETAAGQLGLDARRMKSIAFALSAAVAGPAGAIYASSTFYIEPGDVFEIQTSVTPIIMAMLGGAGTVLGPVLGAVLFQVLEQTVWARFVAVHSGVLGVSVVLLALFLPRGILDGWRRVGPWRRLVAG